MTPAMDASREARAREVLLSSVGTLGFTSIAPEQIACLTCAMLAFADTEAASQPREGDAIALLRKVPKHCLTRDLADEIRRFFRALTQRPPEQAGAVPDATRLTITVNTDGSTSFHSNIPPGQSWQATHAAMARGLREFQRQFDESDKCPVKALSAAPTPPDAGQGEAIAPGVRAHLIFDDWDKHPDSPPYWFRLPSWVQEYATECVAVTERRLATPKASAETIGAGEGA